MSDRALLVRSLNLLDQAGLALLVDVQNAERRAQFCQLVNDQQTTIAADCQLGEVDVLRRNIVSLSQEIVSATSASRGEPDPKRVALIVSFTRTLRGNIRRLLPHLHVDRAASPE